MAILKHIASKNTDYGEAERYLIFQHDEYTQNPILDDNGNMLLREEYYLDGINCDPFTFDVECRETNAFFHKNQSFNDIKSHHYIISFDPKDQEEHGLTGEQAQWYVRSRLVEEKEATADANSDRIERQKQYLAAFGGKAAEQFRKNPLFLLTLYQKIKDFSVTNLSAAEVTYLGTLLFRGGFQDTGILSIKGEASMGETYAEFHVDEQAMYEMVLEVFYRKAGKDHEK